MKLMRFDEQRLLVKVPNKNSLFTEVVRRFFIRSEHQEENECMSAVIIVDPKLFWRLPDDAQIYVGEDRTMGTITVRDIKRELKEFHRRQMNKQ